MDLCPELHTNEVVSVSTEFCHHFLLGQSECAVALFKVLERLLITENKASSEVVSKCDDFISHSAYSNAASLEDRLILRRNSVLIKQIFNHNVEKKQRLIEELENQISLCSVNPLINDSNSLRELHQCLQTFTHQELSSCALQLLNLSNASLSCLQQLLQREPIPAHRLVTRLIRPFYHDPHITCCTSLHKLYISAMISLCVEDLPLDVPLIETNFLKLLLQFDPPDLSKELTNDDFSLLFSETLRVYGTAADSIATIIGIFLSKQCQLLSQFPRFCDQQYLLLDKKVNSPNLSSEEHLLLSQLVNDQIDLWKLISLHSLHQSNPNQHFLESILTLTYRLAVLKDWTNLTIIIGKYLLSELKPLLLVLLWPICEHLEDAAQLSAILKCDSASSVPIMLRNVCDRIAEHHKLVETTVNAVSLGDNCALNVSNAFRSVGNQSKLRILCNVYNLGELDSSVVSSILQEKNESTSELCWECDDNVFRGFTVLHLMIQAILCFHPTSAMRQNGHSTEEVTFVSKFNECLAADKVEAAEKHYEVVILSRLRRCEDLLQSLFPLSLRLEVIENLYSLVFTTTNMVSAATNSSDLSSDDEPHGEDKTDTPRDEQQERLEISGSRENLEPPRINLSTWKTKTRKLDRVSFLCPPYLVRDLLLISQSALKQLVSHVTNMSDPSVANQQPITIEREKALSTALHIPDVTALETRINRLGETLSESLWRLSLFSSKLPIELGVIQKPKVSDKSFSFKVKKVKATRKRCNTNTTRSTGSSISREGSEKDSTGQCSGKSKTMEAQLRQLRSISRVKSSESDIVRSMMSDADSILAYCLLNNDQEEAQNALKRLESSSRGSSLAGEVRFFHHFHQALDRLEKCSVTRCEPMNLNETIKMDSKQSPSSEQQDQPDSLPGESHFGAASLSAIRKLTISNKTHSSTAQIVEDLLSMSSEHLPSHVLHLESPNSSVIETQLHNAAIILDLCVSGASQLADVKIILQKAHDRLTLNSNSEVIRVPLCDPNNNDIKPNHHRLSSMLSVVSSNLTQIRQFEAISHLNDFQQTFQSILLNVSSVDTQLIRLSLIVHSINEKILTHSQPRREIPMSDSLMSGVFYPAEQREHSSLAKSSNSSSNASATPINSITDSQSGSSTTASRGSQDGGSEKSAMEKFSDLIEALESGKLKVFKSRLPLNSCQYYQYLESLGDHIALFSKFMKEQVDKDEKKGSVENSEPVTLSVDNQFLVVYDSPAKVVAKLLFEKDADPAQLDRICHGLGLSISHVILQACCPNISTKHDTEHSLSSKFPTESVVFNSGSVSVKLENCRVTGQDVLSDCINQIVSAITDFSECTPVSSRSPDNLMTYLTNNANIHNIFNYHIHQLATMDLNSLKTLQQKMAFYLNLHNLMMFHLICKLRQIDIKEYSLKDFEFYMHRRRFCYLIGQLGPVSLFDIRTQLLKIADNCSVNKSWRKFDDSINWVPRTDRFSLNTTSGNRMLVFGLIDGFISSMPLQVYTELNVVHELTANLEFIIRKALNKFSETNQVHLPEFLQAYSSQFTRNRTRSVSIPADRVSLASSSVDTGHSSTDIEEDLLTFLLSHCSSDLQNEATVLQNRDERDAIVWSRAHPTLGVCTTALHFIYSDELQRTLTGSMVHTEEVRTADQPLSNTEKREHFSMTSSALDFIFESSPLLATLLLLVVGDEVEVQCTTPTAQPLTDTESTAETSSEKKETETYSAMLNIRSYRYERLAREFLTLGEWIRCYWCKFKSSNMKSPVDPLMDFCSNLPPTSVMLSLLCHPFSKVFHDALKSHLNSLYQSSSWEEILSVVTSLPHFVTNSSTSTPIIRPIRDFALRQLILNATDSPADSKRRLAWLFHFSESTEILYGDFLARCLPFLEAEEALELLEKCSATLKNEVIAGNMSADNKLSDVLNHYIPRMRVYSEVATLIRSHDSPITRATSPSELIYWPKLEEISQSYPEFVLQQMLRWKAFPLASKWAAIFLPEVGSQKIEAAYLEGLVENDNVLNSVEFLERLFYILFNFPDGASFVWQVSINLAGNIPSSPLAVQLASGFSLKHVTHLLTDNSTNQEASLLLSKAFVGASMLRALPSFTIRDMYQHLMLSPDLILEQLIMNLQIELCKQLLEQYRIQRGPSSLHNSSDSQNDTFCEPASPCPFPHTPGSIEYLPLTRIPELEPSAVNKLLITYARKSVKLGALLLADQQDHTISLKTEEFSLQTIKSNILTRRNSCLSVDETSDFNSTVCSPSADTLEATTTPDSDRFVMPTEPVPRENWVTDDKAIICMCCHNERFSMFNRRHHCRQCGRVVCSTCSENRHIISNMSSRVCKQCFAELTRLAACSPSSTMKSATSDFLAPLRPRQTTLIGCVDEGWRLSKEDEENEAIRQDFSFEQTPSITLCLSLLDLHSNSNNCGQSILELCDYLSSFLTPGKDNRPNPEVDYPLVISIIRHLLYKAKLKFSRVSNSEATLRCDVYLSQLDLLHVLIQSNYRRLPSLSQLTRKDQVGAFRDRLIHSERLELAMEVSTKAGLPCAPVWSAMALRSLENGDYAEARSYMKRCLTPLKDKNSLNPLQGPLNDVIKLLEGRRPSGVLISDILSSVEGLNNLLDEPEKRIRDDPTMNREALDECMFYLETYATHFHFLQFLVRHNYWNRAVSYARDLKVSPDVFIEGLVAPALLIGKFKTLRDQMVMLDSTLKSWESYLERLCMHLEKNGHVEELYNIQVLSGDFLRAAITCIYQFFLKGANSYVELNSRIPHLKTASQHLENALKDALRSRDSAKSNKIQRYIKVVKMQEEGTRFLAQPACIKYMTSAYAYKAKGLPSLFSEDGNSKLEFCLIIIFSSAVLLDGLTTACRIINECHMKPVPILSRAGYHLLSLMRTNLPEAENSLRELVQEMRGLCYVMDSDDSDNIILSILTRMTEAERKGSTAEEFIKRIVSKDTKIRANLLTLRFRPAYLLAVQLNNQQHIEKIAQEAEKAGDNQIAEICKKRIRELNASRPQLE